MLTGIIYFPPPEPCAAISQMATADYESVQEVALERCYFRLISATFEDKDQSASLSECTSNLPGTTPLVVESQEENDYVMSKNEVLYIY